MYGCVMINADSVIAEDFCNFGTDGNNIFCLVQVAVRVSGERIFSGGIAFCGVGMYNQNLNSAVCGDAEAKRFF